MVLESLITPYTAEKKPWEMVFLGILFSTVALFISIQIFETMAGLIAVFLTVFACVPLFYNTMKFEEQKDLLPLPERKLLREHARALTFFMCLFLGTVISFVAWYLFLPTEVSQKLFEIQITTIKNINAHSVLGSLTSVDLFNKIFFNNIKVLIFCILFSFFYGSGAIFILTWNASVVAVAIGSFIKKNLASAVSSLGLAKITGFAGVVSFGFMRYLFHGIPEILAYFIGGLAGGIISVAVIQHDLSSDNFERIVFDAADLVLIAVAVLFVAGLLEVYVTPIIF
ncbi:MAG: stage II sporulation protein M [Candidatus Woesearchaeota archaeon]|nr:stage II sporulation protein M [Candidatus Woesearchaeota archaeon]